ncbi:hypothetical protein ABTN30_19785, partial [Acinetobacter baumannii]
MAGRRIVELARAGQDYRGITEAMAKEYPNIPLARYRKIVGDALDAGGVPHAREILKRVDPETNQVVYRRGRLIVGSGSVMVPEHIVADM